MEYSKIYRAGVEFEGSWDCKDRPTGYRGDGSVTTRCVWDGEVGSEPLKPGELVEFIRKDGPYPAYVNSSCGMHIHVSTRTPGEYAVLMDDEFNDAYRRAFKNLLSERFKDKEKVGKSAYTIHSRFEGKNTYCLKDFIPYKQFKNTGKGYSRYTQLNFCHGVHKTLELRVLPMMASRELAADTVEYYLKFVDDYLVSHAKELEDPAVDFKDDYSSSLFKDSPILLRA